MRAEMWSFAVTCANKDCDDYDVPRVIEIPHLGDGVFLSPTTAGPFGLAMLNLTCGTCLKNDVRALP